MALTTLFFLCIAGFIAAEVDSIAGGGGMISLPAVIAAGVPPHLALGTNKFASTFASFTSSIQFARSDKINLMPLQKVFFGLESGRLYPIFIRTMSLGGSKWLISPSKWSCKSSGRTFCSGIKF